MAELIARRNRIRQFVPHLASASGSIASFQTDMRSALEEIKIHFNPQQAAGTPSPTNVLPITGWTGCDLYRTGKNLFDINTPIEYGEFNNSSGAWTPSASRLATNYISINSGQTYTISVKATNADNLAFNNYALFNKDKTWLGNRSQNGDTAFNGTFSHAFTVNIANAEYIRVVFRDATSAGTHIDSKTLANAEFQMELGSTATSYAPYVGNQIPVSWTSYGTVYGGWANPLTGEGLATMAYRRFTGAADENWSGSGGSARQVFACVWNEVKRANISGNYVIACNIAIPDNSNDNDPPYGYIRNNNSSYNIRTHFFNENVSQTELRAFLASNPLELVCPLITPIPFTFTPISPLKTLKGTNNIWANANGNTEVKFWKH